MHKPDNSHKTKFRKNETKVNSLQDGALLIKSSKNTLVTFIECQFVRPGLAWDDRAGTGMVWNGHEVAVLTWDGCAKWGGGGGQEVDCQTQNHFCRKLNVQLSSDSISLLLTLSAPLIASS